MPSLGESRRSWPAAAAAETVCGHQSFTARGARQDQLSYTRSLVPYGFGFLVDSRNTDFVLPGP